MSAQCRCVNSYLHPHRVDMCLIYGSRKEKEIPARAEQPGSVPIAEASVVTPESPVPGEESPVDESEEMADEEIDDLETLPVADQVPEFVALNATLMDGNERCDCFMFRISKHRKFRCAWKNHGLSVAGAAVVGAAIMSSVLIGGERNDTSCVPDDEGQLIPASPVRPTSTHSEGSATEKARQHDVHAALVQTTSASAPATPIPAPAPFPAPVSSSSEPELDWRHGDAELPSGNQKAGGQAVAEEDQDDEHATNARLAFQDARMRERDVVCARLHAERVAEKKRQAEQQRLKQAREQREREEDERAARFMEDAEAEFDLDTFKI